MVAPADPFGESWHAEQLSSRRAALVIHGAVGRRWAVGAGNADVIGDDGAGEGAIRRRPRQLRDRRIAAVSSAR